MVRFLTVFAELELLKFNKIAGGIIGSVLKYKQITPFLLIMGVHFLAGFGEFSGPNQFCIKILFLGLTL